MADESQGFFQAIFSMPRYAPAWFSAFLFGVSLLFLNELPVKMKNHLVPSLLAYSLGAAILGTFHRFLAVNYRTQNYNNNETPIPLCWKMIICFLHGIWFSSFITYNIFRQVF